MGLLVLLLLAAYPMATNGPSPTSVGGASAGTSGGPSIVVAPAYLPGPGVRALGPLANGTNLTVVVTLASRDPAGLAAEANLVSTPGSPEFRAFLSPSEVADRYGATPAEYAAALAYFEGRHLSVLPSPDRLFLTVRGPASAIGESFSTQFEQFREGGTVVFSHTTPARLPAGIAWAAALGLGNLSGPRPLVGPPEASTPSAPPRPQAGCPTGSPYAPCQIARAYNLSGLLANGTNGTGVRVGVVDVYSSSENASALASDLTAFENDTGTPAGPLQFVYPVPTSRNLNVSTNSVWGLEDALDLEWARGVAPGATLDMTLSPDASTGLYASVDWLVAHHAVDVLSMSWGEPDVGVFNAYSGACTSECNASSDGSYTLLHPVLLAAAAEGIGVFAASGDCGAAWGTSGVSTGYPASDPWVTGVGATTLTLSSGNAYGSETAWSGNASGASSPGCQNQGGSGGGFSPFPRPAWQSAPGVSGTLAQRGVPDVSIHGGSPVEIIYQGQSSGVYGTSASTPMWAGLAAVADQLAGGPIGFLDPTLYAAARSPGASADFHDITVGSNGYPAASGWDPVTGLGSPNAGTLLPLLAAPAWHPSVGGLALLASPRIAGTGANVSFVVNASVGSAGVTLVDLDFGDGNATLAPNGSAHHAYSSDGVYIARAVAFDASGNSTVSWPVLLVVGGGTALQVALTPSTSTPSVGAAVGFTTSVQGGSGPYRYTYLYGDGTYWSNATSPISSRAYATPGAYCAFVVVSDSARPQDGGISNGTALGVGGAPANGCPAFATLSVRASAGYAAADMPGDFPIQVVASGGAPPVTTQLLSDDPYVAACNCAIFRPGETNVGNHTITVYANDSFHDGAIARVNVTVYPSLVATFSASPLLGVAPLTVNVGALAQGGHLPDANRTVWNFGDGTNGTGAALSHTYSTPGFYTVVGRLSDQGHGNGSEAFLLDVLPSGGSSPLAVTAQVLPAELTAAGYPMQFRAFPTGGTAPYTVRWSLGQNDSAFGPAVTQTYTRSGCLALSTCPLTVGLHVTDATGAQVNASIVLGSLFALRWSGLTLTETLSGSQGVTPWTLSGNAQTEGVRGATVNWTWGDGNYSVGARASHTYLLPGNYTVTETAVTTYGDLLVRTHAVVVTGQALQAPTVSGGPVRSWGIAPATIDFSVQGAGGQGAPYFYNWTFGDGTNGSGSFVAHTYPSPGLFLANVTVLDRVGASTTVQYRVDIYNVTRVAISATALLDANATHLLAAISIQPECSGRSVPSCAPAEVTLDAFWTNASGAPPVANQSLPPISFGASGWANVSFPLPPDPAAYALALSAGGANYTGVAFVPIPALPHGGGGPPPRASTSPLPFLVAGILAGAVVAVVAHVLERRRRGLG